MAIITITPDGQALIVGIKLTADIPIHIAPEEAAVVVPVEDLAAFLEALVGETADTDEKWDFADLVRRLSAGEPA